MKFLLIASIFALSLAVPASAQEYQGCWMIDGARQLIRLPELCPQPQPSPTASTAAPTYQPLPADAVARTAAFYAGRYCDQRETGVMNREDAKRLAGDETQLMMENLYGFDQTSEFITSSWATVLDAADRSIALQCAADA